MIQAKISLQEEEATFLEKHRALGFKDKSSMVREALRLLRSQREQEALARSADLYADLYETDPELQALTDSAIQDWPE